MLEDLRRDLRWRIGSGRRLDRPMERSFNIGSSVYSAPSARQNSTSNTTLLKDMIDVLEAHARGFREETVDNGHNDTSIQNPKQNVSKV